MILVQFYATFISAVMISRWFVLCPVIWDVLVLFTLRCIMYEYIGTYYEVRNIFNEDVLVKGDAVDP